MDNIDYEKWAVALCKLLDQIEASESLEEAIELSRTRFGIAEDHGLVITWDQNDG